MSTKSKSNRVTEQANNLAMINGLNKHPTLTSFMVGGATVLSTDVVASLQADNAAMAAVIPAKAAWQVAVKAAATQHQTTRAMVAGVRQSLQTMFAGQGAVLADFGLAPRKVPATRTPQEKAASAAKAKATREARGTLGPVKKQSVKGNVTGVVVTPVTAPPAAAASGSSPTSPGAGTGAAGTPTGASGAGAAAAVPAPTAPHAS